MSLFEKKPGGKKSENRAKPIDQKVEFIKEFKTLAYSHSPFSVWKDFVTMFAISLSNPVDKSHFEERENRYLDIIHSYEAKEERDIFPKLAARVVMALEEEPEQDFLGSIFMELGLGNGMNGQTFTPYPIARLMAAVTHEDIVNSVKQNDYTTVIDPCCGSGVNLIAAIHLAKEKLTPAGINFQNTVLVSAQDIDETVGLMCYIQISLLGMAGYVKIGDTLSGPYRIGDSMENYWFTPMYFSPVWTARRMMREIKNEEETPNVKI